MKRIILSLIFLSTLGIGTNAQVQFGTSMTFGAGISIFHGDIESSKLIPKFKNRNEYQPALSYYLNQRVAPAIDFCIGLGGARIQGTHEERNTGSGLVPGAYFNAWLYEFTARLDISPMRFIPGRGEVHNWGFVIQTGGMGYSSKLYRLHDNASWSGSEENQGPSSKGTDFHLGTGLYYRYPYGENMEIGVTSMMRHLFHDNLDSWTGGSSNDKYTIVEFTLVYHFRSEEQKEKQGLSRGPGVSGKAKKVNDKRRLKWTHQSPTK